MGNKNPISNFKLLYYKIRFSLILDGTKRADYLRKKKLLRHIGDKVHFQTRELPRDPYMIKIHNNVRIASNVTFITHDGLNKMFNNIEKDSARYHLGCIEIMDNVVIGSNSTILYNVRIGKNVVVAAGSVVTRDVPDGSIVGGNPAKVIGSFEDLHNKRRNEKKQLFGTSRIDYIEWLWNEFDEMRK